jgi:hypothetical protein
MNKNKKAADVTLERRVRARQQAKRERYPEVRGRRVDWIYHEYLPDENVFILSVRFLDGHEFTVTLSASLVATSADFSRWQEEEGEEVVLKEYFSQDNPTPAEIQKVISGERAWFRRASRADRKRVAG